MKLLLHRHPPVQAWRWRCARYSRRICAASQAGGGEPETAKGGKERSCNCDEFRPECRFRDGTFTLGFLVCVVRASSALLWQSSVQVQFSSIQPPQLVGATAPILLWGQSSTRAAPVTEAPSATQSLSCRFEMDINPTPVHVASQISEYALCNYMHQLTTRTGRDLKAREFEEGWQRDSRNPSNPFAINTYSITKANTTATAGHATVITVASTAHGLVSNNVIVLNVVPSMTGSPSKDANATWGKLLNGKQFVTTCTHAGQVYVMALIYLVISIIF